MLKQSIDKLISIMRPAGMWNFNINWINSSKQIWADVKTTESIKDGGSSWRWKAPKPVILLIATRGRNLQLQRRLQGNSPRLDFCLTCWVYGLSYWFLMNKTLSPIYKCWPVSAWFHSHVLRLIDSWLKASKQDFRVASSIVYTTCLWQSWLVIKINVQQNK